MKISVTSNISNRVKKIREGAVYSEWTCFVAELIQNSQRAKAGNIDIETYPEYFRITDNGIGCDSPEKVFTLDFSGWGNDVYSPFGEGFSSTFAIADQVIVRSQNWEAYLDLDEAIKTGDFDSVRISLIPPIEGFEVVLYFDKKYDVEEIKKEVKKIGAMVGPAVRLNGELITKKTISYKPFTIRKRLRDFGEIIVAPAEDYEPLEIIYEGRPVTNIYIQGIKGLLALRPGAVTLRAPDRRDIVYDDKRYRLKERLEKLSEEILYTLVTDFPEKIPEFKFAIKDTLSPSQYARKLSYGLKPKRKNKTKSTAKQHRIADIGLPIFEPKKVAAENKSLVHSYDETSSNVCEDSQEEITEIRKLVRQSKIFYRLYHEENLKDMQAKIEYYGMTVLVVDELAAEALRWMNVPHLEEAGHKVYQRFNYKNIGPRTKKEERILELLEPIAKHYNVSPRVFDFADIECIVETQVGDKVVNRERISVNGVCDRTGNWGKILLSRKELGIRQLDITYGAALGTTKDLKVLMNIVPTVAHELCHLLYDSQDNTLEMAKEEKRLTREIFELITRIY